MALRVFEQKRDLLAYALCNEVAVHVLELRAAHVAQNVAAGLGDVHLHDPLVQDEIAQHR